MSKAFLDFERALRGAILRIILKFLPTRRRTRTYIYRHDASINSVSGSATGWRCSVYARLATKCERGNLTSNIRPVILFHPSIVRRKIRQDVSCLCDNRGTLRANWRAVAEVSKFISISRDKYWLVNLLFPSLPSPFPLYFHDFAKSTQEQCKYDIWKWRRIYWKTYIHEEVNEEDFLNKNLQWSLHFVSLLYHVPNEISFMSILVHT